MALDRAAKLVGRLAYNRAVKDAVRDAQVSLLRPCLLSSMLSTGDVLTKVCRLREQQADKLRTSYAWTLAPEMPCAGDTCTR